MIDSFAGEYEFLSNFYPSEIRGRMFVYKTVEHAFQAQKTTVESQKREITLARTPGAAKRLGRQVELRSDWEEIKDAVMLWCLREKFYRDLREVAGNRGLGQLLLETGNEQLIEGNTWGDRYWGAEREDGAWQGWNRLGQLLEQVRGELRQRSDLLV